MVVHVQIRQITLELCVLRQIDFFLDIYMYIYLGGHINRQEVSIRMYI